MPPTDPKDTPAATPANDSTESKAPGLFAHFWTWTPQAHRFLFWAGVTVALTCGMRAATHLLDGSKPDAQADVNMAAGGHSSGSGFGGGGWWNPSSAIVDATPAGPASPSSDSSSPPGGKSIIPADLTARFPSSPLNLVSPVPVGSSSSREAYAILGLGRGSGGRLGSSSARFSGDGSGSELHFSMSGDLNLIPIDNLAAGGLSLNLVAVPEPSIAGLMAIALAGLALKRHRKPRSAA
ncbi:MAG: PEP-CTERM sorting domain-containing protein [Chthoniobacter sp.]|uniref:PEP-CTERM sorting domain-containing protein n=1 Tax=Chthoniobacter sp. TaxID=2510640 RepID=UPI0032AE0A28